MHALFCITEMDGQILHFILDSQRQAYTEINWVIKLKKKITCKKLLYQILQILLLSVMS